MKYLAMRKRILMELGVLAVILTLIGVGCYITSNYKTGLETQHARLKATILGLDKQLQEFREKMASSEKAKELFEAITKGSQGGVTISREFAQKTLTELKAKHHLSALTMKMSPIEEVNNPKYKKDTVRVLATQINLKFEGISDASIFSFIQEMTSALTGYVRISDLKIQRTAAITDEKLLAISQGQMPTLVSGEMNLDWLGLRLISQEAAKEP